MSFKLVFAAAALGVALSAGSAFAYERHYNFREVWGDAVREHGRDEALSATPRDVMRHYPRQLTEDGPHDPSGRIILEGASVAALSRKSSGAAPKDRRSFFFRCAMAPEATGAAH